MNTSLIAPIPGNANPYKDASPPFNPPFKRLIPSASLASWERETLKIVKESKPARNPEPKIIEMDGGLSMFMLKLLIDGVKFGNYYIHLL